MIIIQKLDKVASQQQGKHNWALDKLAEPSSSTISGRLHSFTRLRFAHICSGFARRCDPRYVIEVVMDLLSCYVGYGFNEMQTKIADDLLDYNSVIVSPAGSGKTISVISSIFYHLHAAKAPAHAILLCADELRCKMLYQCCLKLKYPLNVNVYTLHGDNQDEQLAEGKNIFICWVSGDLPWILQRDFVGSELVSMTIFDADTLMVTPRWKETDNVLRDIPMETERIKPLIFQIVSNSYCKEMDQNIKSLKLDNLKMHKLDYNHEHLKFWFVFHEMHLRRVMFQELCKAIPQDQGIRSTSG